MSELTVNELIEPNTNLGFGVISLRQKNKDFAELME